VSVGNHGILVVAAGVCCTLVEKKNTTVKNVRGLGNGMLVFISWAVDAIYIRGGVIGEWKETVDCEPTGPTSSISVRAQTCS